MPPLFGILEEVWLSVFNFLRERRLSAASQSPSEQSKQQLRLQSRSRLRLHLRPLPRPSPPASPAQSAAPSPAPVATPPPSPAPQIPPMPLRSARVVPQTPPAAPVTAPGTIDMPLEGAGNGHSNSAASGNGTAVTAATGGPTPLNSINIVRLPGVYGDQVLAALARRGYRLGKSIGEGSYCKVRVAYKSYTNGYTRKCACKTVDRRRASQDFVSKFLPRELSIIRSVRHPHIVTILDIIDVDDFVYIFMDICERGDLLDYIRNRGPLSEGRARHFFKQLVSAVAYLHSLDISHRDLKCENVLLASKECVKIADFGFARWCRDENGRRILSDTFCGSAAYAAPEILQGTPYNPKMYDAWSLGCILYIMLTATMPFDDSNVKQMLKMQMARRLTFPARCDTTVSAPARKLITHLLEPDVTRRATILQVGKSSWLR